MEISQFPQRRTKNILINPGFRVNERGYVSGTAAAANGEYTLDKWRLMVAGEAITFAALSADNEITCPAGGLSQRIEDLNVRGGVYTISWSGTATCKVAGISRSTGESFTLPANTVVDIIFYGGTLKFAQLEEGSIVTEREYRTIGEELQLCARYFQRLLGEGASKRLGTGQCRSAVFVDYPIWKKVKTRVSGTISFSSDTGFQAMQATGDNVTSTAVVAVNSSKDMVYIRLTVTGMVAGDASNMKILENEYIDIDAEV